MSMKKMYGVLIRFLNGDEELHGIYNSFNEAKNAVGGFLKFVEKKYYTKDFMEVGYLSKPIVINNENYEVKYVGPFKEKVNFDDNFPLKFKVIKVISGRFLDNKNNKLVQTESNLYNKKEEKYKTAQKVAALINSIYFEKDIEKKRQLIENSLIICQKSRHNIRSYPEIIEYLDDVKKILKPYKGGFINEDAEKYFLTKIVPFFQEHDDDGYVYCLDIIH